MPWCMDNIATETVRLQSSLRCCDMPGCCLINLMQERFRMRIGKYMRMPAFVALVTVAVALAGCGQFEPRDKRFYYRAMWNFALREDLAELDSEFNGVDFGHSNLYENLLLTGGRDVPAIEDKARRETLAFIATKPRLRKARLP